MTMAMKRTVGADREYYLARYGHDWYWQSISDPADSWGNYGSKGAALEAAVKRGYTIV